jgi:exodeoxyribonuclease VIII
MSTPPNIVIRSAGARDWLGEFTPDELSNEAYHSAPGISKSHLDIIAEQSPLHYWQEYLNPRAPVRERTPALALGDCIHAAVLQPALFESRYAVKPDVDRRTKDGKEIYARFLRDNPDKTHMSQSEYDTCRAIRDAVYSHSIARGLMTGGVPERSFFMRDLDTVELIKCRPDYLTDDYIVDLKSTLHADPENFSKDATKYRYDVAVPWYLDIITSTVRHYPSSCSTSKWAKRKWIWLAVEKEPPYAVGIYMAQEHDIARARDTARRDMTLILQHRQRGLWPDYGDTIRPLEIKPWARR